MWGKVKEAAQNEAFGPSIALVIVAAVAVFGLIYQLNSTASGESPPAAPHQPKDCRITTVEKPVRVSSPSGAGSTLNIFVPRDGSVVERESGVLAIKKTRLCPGSILTMHVTQFTASGGGALPLDQVVSWAQVLNSGTSLTVWVVVAPHYLTISGAGVYYGTITLDSSTAQGANIPVSINITYQNLPIVFAFGFLAAFGGFTWAWLLHSATNDTIVPGHVLRHFLLCAAVLLATAIPIVDSQVLTKLNWQGTLIQYIGLGTLIGAAAIALTPTLRALALPRHLQEQRPN